MPFARIPWWLWLVAASFLACFVVGFFYLPFKLPEAHGINLAFDGRVLSVAPGSPGDAAGLKSADKIVNVDGQEVKNLFELGRVLCNTTFDHAVPVVVLRGSQELHLQLKLNRTLVQGWTSKEYWGWTVEVAVSLIQLLVGLLVLFKRPRDITALAAGIFLCCLGTGNPLFLASPGVAVIWRSLPLALQWLVFPVVVLNVSGLPLVPMLLFSLAFPTPLLNRRWAWVMLAGLSVPLLGIVAIGDYIVLFGPKHAEGAVPTWVGVFLGLDLLIIFLSSVAILAGNYFRLREVNEKRRIRLVVFGLFLFLVNLLAAGLFSISQKTFWLSQIALSPLLFGIVQIPFTICVAYAVLRQRLFQVSFIVRQGLQYAVARGILLIPIPILAGILIFDVMAHKDKPVGALLSAHGWAYALIGVVGIVAHTKRSRWMAVLDRRFYREHYDAQHLLRQTMDEIRASSNLADLAPNVVARIEQALHPEFVAILMRDAGEPLYRCVVSAPPGVCPRGLSAESKLMAVFRLFAKPMQISLAESGWLKQQLPPEDTGFLREARIDLMVPITIAPQGREALMVLGPKKSEEPYGREDQELLSGIASALALLLERPAAASSGFEECPRCGLCYESGMVRCAQEGSQLTQVPFQRLLSSRYRLERRLGRGGMGTVYKATDTSLERAVAVKLIREDLIASADVGERFRREARAAAAIAHPNLVTVYDFGVDADRRVFLVMELLQGGTLREHFEQHKKFSPQRILQVLAGVCAGLEAAHEHGLVHRDLKPENIFLGQSGEGEVTKILDFGLAKFLLSPVAAAAPTLDSASAPATIETASGILVGTPQYMSPDQLNGEPVSPAWDIWALGVITYEMLTGTHPFPALSVGQMQYAIVHGRFTPLSASLPEAPAQWQQFFERALSPETAARPRSAREFVATLGNAFAVAGKSTSV